MSRRTDDTFGLSFDETKTNLALEMINVTKVMCVHGEAGHLCENSVWSLVSRH